MKTHLPRPLLILQGHDASADAASQVRSSLSPAPCLCAMQVVRLLLGAGADVGACTAAEGLTALHLAAVMGHAEVAHLLIEGGACTTTFDNNDHTAVDMAFTAGQEALGIALSQVPTDEVSTRFHASPEL